MSQRQHISVGLSIIVALSCLLTGNSSAQPTSKPSTRPATQKPWAPRADCTGFYGKPQKLAVPEASLADLMRAPATFASKRIKVSGVVQDVCRKKGCWMLLKSGKHVMRVRFSGYSFFVPVNSKGYGVTVYGTAKETVIPERLARHYAEESGNPEKAKTIKGPQKTVVFTAEWVKMYKLPNR